MSRVKAWGRFSLVRTICACVLLALAASSAAAAIAAYGGRFSLTLDHFTHFALFYAAVGLFAGAFALLTNARGRRLTLALCIVAVLASLGLMAPELVRETGHRLPETAPGTIKVIQFNALRTNTDLRRTVNWLIAQNPDVVAVSEARADLRDLLVARTGWKVAGAKGTLMIFTRERYLRMERPRLPKGSQLTFVNATYAMAGGEIEVVTTHLDWPTRPIFRRQPQDLESVASRRPTARMLLLGDFNNTPWSRHIRGLDSRLDLIRRDKAVATWPAQVLGRAWPLPFLPIDHIYAGPGWATIKVERGPWLGSDHYPLIVTLAPIPG